MATRIRKGGGIGAVRQALTPFLNAIKYSGSVESTYFLISVDNDRRPLHPEHLQRDDFKQLSKKEQTDPCRRCEIEGKIQAKLGKDQSTWPISGAIAIPVEMLESWLLLICDPAKYGTEAKLPVFSDKNKASATKYYGSKKKVPDQLKDLVDSERQTLGQSKQEFYRHCASILDPDALAQVSLSFAQFLSQVISWN
ncbi:MAG: hypothetical protein ACFB0E_17885 [Leptolyngbyaceae cyanobacterium]